MLDSSYSSEKKNKKRSNLLIYLSLILFKRSCTFVKLTFFWPNVIAFDATRSSVHLYFSVSVGWLMSIWGDFDLLEARFLTDFICLSDLESRSLFWIITKLHKWLSLVLWFSLIIPAASKSDNPLFFWVKWQYDLP